MISACECDIDGSTGISCSDSGQCACKENIEGVPCDRCTVNHYDFPNCYGMFAFSFWQWGANFLLNFNHCFDSSYNLSLWLSWGSIKLLAMQWCGRMHVQTPCDWWKVWRMCKWLHWTSKLWLLCCTILWLPHYFRLPGLQLQWKGKQKFTL